MNNLIYIFFNKKNEVNNVVKCARMFFFFFFLTCPLKGRGGGIRTCDLRFIRYGSQSIELPLEDNVQECWDRGSLTNKRHNTHIEPSFVTNNLGHPKEPKSRLSCVLSCRQIFLCFPFYIPSERAHILSPASISNSRCRRISFHDSRQPLRFWLKKAGRGSTLVFVGWSAGSRQIVRHAPSLGNSNFHDFPYVPFIFEVYFLEMHYFGIPQFPNALF
jgi:hypothetical protein